MGYSGATIPIPIGGGGLLSDLSPANTPATALILANNIRLHQGYIEKSPGDLRWNDTPFSTGIVALHDYSPLPGKQYTIVVTRDGRVWRMKDRFNAVEIVPDTNPVYVNQSGAPPTTLVISERVQIVEGGQEFLGDSALTQPKKLFIFTGNSPIQVILGEDTVRHNILAPAADWDGSTGHQSYPSFGIISQSRLFVGGVDNFPHMSYVSSDTYGVDSTMMYGHEDFTSSSFNTALFNVYPGDGIRGQMFFNYKTKLWLLKYPRGLYTLQVPDIGTPTGWYFQKVNEDVGTPTISGAAAMEDDVWVMNSVGSVQSLSATLNLGGVEAADMLKAMQISTFVRNNTSPLGFGERQAIWHQATQTAYFLYRKINSPLNSFMIAVDLTQEKPKPTIILKSQPNVLALRKNAAQVEEMIYGSEDGYIYTLDRPSRYVGDPDDQNGYVGEFQTPHLILGNSNQFMFNLSAQNDKLFDFVEVEYMPTGDMNLNCDVYIDGRNTQTKVFKLNKGNRLGQFLLGSSRLQGKSSRRQRLRIYGRGRTISLHFYDDGLPFNFKIVGITIYARLGGVDEKGSMDAGTRNNQPT